jgi:cysteine desulfurase
VGNIKIDVNEMKIDLLSLSGHKLHAPKGWVLCSAAEG